MTKKNSFSKFEDDSSRIFVDIPQTIYNKKHPVIAP